MGEGESGGMAFLKAISPLASWSRARWFSSFFDQRIRIARLRLSHEWQASTTQRRARAGAARLEVDLVAAAADMRGEPVLVDEFARVGVVVGAVEGDRLRLLRGRLGPGDRDRVERALQQRVVVAVGALVPQPDRDSRALAEDRPLRPLLALSVGLGRSSARPAALWSLRRRRPARPSRSRSPGRSPAVLAARTRGRRPPAPTPESAGAPPTRSRRRPR